jgi:phage-related minor tail protein
MTDLNAITLELKVTGEEAVTAAVKRLTAAQEALSQKIKVSVDAGAKKSRSLDQVTVATKKAENEIKRHATAMSQGVITGNQYQREINRISARLKAMGLEEAQKKVMSFGRRVADANRELQTSTAIIKQVEAANKRLSASTDRVSTSKVRVAAAAKSATDATSRTRQAFLNTANSIAILDGPLGGVASRFSAFGVLIGRTGILLGTFAVGLSALGVATTKSIRAFMEFEVQTAKIEAVLKTTGSQSGLTASEIESMSARIALSTLESESSVRSAASQLLTFRNVSKNAFEEVLKSAADMAALGFGTVESEAVKLAKALEDPRQSLASLSRSGITFTRQQRQVIIAMVESGRQGEAMAKILENVNRQVGGAGEAAARDTMAGAFDTISQATARAVREFGSFIIQASGLDKTIKALASGLEEFALGPKELSLDRQVDLARENLNLVLRARAEEGAASQERIAYLNEAIAIQADEAATAEQLAYISQNLAVYQQELNALQQDYGDQALVIARTELSRLETQRQLRDVKAAENRVAEFGRSIDNIKMEADLIRENIGLTEEQIRVRRALAAEGLLGVDIEREINEYVKKLREAGVEHFEIKRLADEARATLEQMTDAAEDYANALRQAAESRALSGVIDSLENENTLMEEQIRLLDEGVSFSDARRQAELNLQLVLAQNLLIEGQITQEKYDQLAASIALNQAMSAEIETRRPVTVRTPRGGGGSRREPTNISDSIAEMEKQVAQERILLGLRGQEQQAMEVYFDLVKRNEKADIKMTDGALMGAAKRIAAEQEKNRVIEEGLKRQQDISNMLESSMEKAFMSIVDGTSSVKDAFKAMASDIIKELYRIFVVKRITGMIAGAIMGGPTAAATSAAAAGAGGLYANGAAFSNGNVVPFANGGVVGSPTTFPMAGGKTGLMGEAGPEAIMPLKRGKDGKLGVAADGGGAVNIVQNFNISANGDDSVKRIVRQQIPQIAEATKAAVVDAKRRGGSYGRAFG